MHGTITSSTSDGITTTNLIIATHRAVRGVLYAVEAAYNNRANEDDESYESRTLEDLMHHICDVDRSVMNDLLASKPASVEDLAAMVLYVDGYNRCQDERGHHDEGRAETLIANLTGSVGLTAAA